MDTVHGEYEAKYKEMTEAPFEPVILKLAVPCIVSMLVTQFYNMADTFFVGMLDNNSATGAVGIVFSIMALIQAIGLFCGQGSGVLISNELGKQNYEEASRLVAIGFFTSLFLGLTLCVGGLASVERLALFLGATDTILPYAKDYLSVILLGAPWMAGAITLNNQLRYQGNATYAMVGITFGSVLNIILDPILIFTFELGVGGAAWATIISQFVSFAILLAGTWRGDTLRISIKNYRFSAGYFKSITAAGFPSMARQGLASAAAICLNFSAKPYGDAVIAAMSIVQRIMMFIASAMVGFGQGFQPFCGFNYGAKKYRRVVQGFWFSVKVSTVFLILIGAIGFAVAPQMVSLFRDDPVVIACGAVSMRYRCVFLFTHAYLVMSTMMLQSMKKTMPAMMLSMARQGLCFIPIILILPGIFGLAGIQAAQAVADTLAALIAVFVQRRSLKELDAMIRDQDENGHLSTL